MSVDTYLKRKNLQPYAPVEHEGVRIYISHSLGRWAKAVYVDAKHGLFSKSFHVEAEHKHNITCAH